MTHATFHLDAVAPVQWWCRQKGEPGNSSWRLGPIGPISTYLLGTPDEIRDLAVRLIAAADEYEAALRAEEEVSAT